MDKIKIITTYDKLSNEIKNLIRLVYPEGYSQHLISIKDKNGKATNALRVETEERIYLVRVTAEQASDVVIFEDEEELMFEDIRESYEVKYPDTNYLSEEENNQESE